MRKFGLIGYPLGHSFSQKYFTEKFLKEEISDCAYQNFPLTNINLLNSLISEEQDLCGLNVTIPYKSDIFRFLDFISSEAKEIGAVNVVKVKRMGGKVLLSGYNSDITGIRDSVLPYITDDTRKALVLGTGGSSRAVKYMLEKAGLKVTLVSRVDKKGDITYSEVSPAVIKSTQLIVNTTPLGMFPNINDKPDIRYDLLGKKHILFDLVYNPEKTLFLQTGEAQGCTVISGIKMLHSQAERSWEIWNDENL